MDIKKIFIKNACPTKVGGQAVLDGIMMKGQERTAIALRLPDKKIYIKTAMLKKPSKAAKIPLLRGVIVFFNSLVEGTKALMQSVDILEEYDLSKTNKANTHKSETWAQKKFSKTTAWNITMYISVIFSLCFTIGVFIIMPTAVVELLENILGNDLILNLSEGILRIALFVIYIVVISRMEDIKNVFRYHGAEHKCIHCYENRLELTPENCQPFSTLHPRCGTSFMMFVMIISLILFSLLGWPNLFWRITSRLILVPVVAGISYEILRWAGRSDNILVKILSIPGLYLQKLTTAEPTTMHLEVAIEAMKAVLVTPETPCFVLVTELDGPEQKT